MKRCLHGSFVNWLETVLNEVVSVVTSAVLASSAQTTSNDGTNQLLSPALPLHCVVCFYCLHKRSLC